jgi:spermidine/putrescine transport system permease protein
MFLVFAQSFDLFVITFLTIGPQSTLPLVVWSMLRTGVNPSINAISTLLLFTSAAMLVIASRFTKITIEV